MDLPTIDISALPTIESSVGLFGSLNHSLPQQMGSLFDIVITIALILYD